MTQKELLDRKFLSKAFRDAEMRELQAIKEIRASKKNSADDTGDQSEVKFECEVCLSPFHPSHVPIPKAKASQTTSLHDIKFLCPSCLRSRRPRIELVLSLLMNYEKISVRLPEGESLTYLTDRALSWQQKAEKLLKVEDVANELKKLSEEVKESKKKVEESD